MKTKLIKTASGMEVRSAKEILMRHTELGAGCKVEYNITEKHILTAMEEYASQFKPTLLTEDKEGEGQEVTDDEIAQEARKRYPYSDDDTEARMNKLSSKRRRFIEGAKWMQFEIIQKQNFKQ